MGGCSTSCVWTTRQSRTTPSSTGELSVVLLSIMYYLSSSSGAIMSSALLLHKLSPELPVSAKFDLLMGYFGWVESECYCADAK